MPGNSTRDPEAKAGLLREALGPVSAGELLEDGVEVSPILLFCLVTEVAAVACTLLQLPLQMIVVRMVVPQPRLLLLRWMAECGSLVGVLLLLCVGAGMCRYPATW